MIIDLPMWCIRRVSLLLVILSLSSHLPAEDYGWLPAFRSGWVEEVSPTVSREFYTSGSIGSDGSYRFRRIQPPYGVIDRDYIFGSSPYDNVAYDYMHAAGLFYFEGQWSTEWLVAGDGFSYLAYPPDYPISSPAAPSRTAAFSIIDLSGMPEFLPWGIILDLSVPYGGSARLLAAPIGSRSVPVFVNANMGQSVYCESTGDVFSSWSAAVPVFDNVNGTLGNELLDMTATLIRFKKEGATTVVLFAENTGPIQLFPYEHGNGDYFSYTWREIRVEEGQSTINAPIASSVGVRGSLVWNHDPTSALIDIPIVEVKIVSGPHAGLVGQVGLQSGRPVDAADGGLAYIFPFAFEVKGDLATGVDVIEIVSSDHQLVATTRIEWQDPTDTSLAALPSESGLYSCPVPVAQITPLTSRVENPQLSHIHTATDFLPASGAAGCGSCGASGGAGGGLATDIRLDRIHRYADFTRPGSFGPGVFSNLDIGLTLWNHGESGEIWDPNAASPIPLTLAGSGRYIDAKRSAIKSLQLYAADGTTLADADSAVIAVATQHDGTTWVFELIQAGLGGDADRQGRLIAIRDRVGNQLTIAYAFPATASDAELGSRSRLLEMATATDQRGRQLSFAYGWTCGQPVVTTLTYPTGARVVYHYDGDIAGVCAIDYPDGTHSTFALRADAASQCMVVDYQDAGAEGTHRTKSVYLTKTAYTQADGVVVAQSPNRVRRVVGPTGEPTYLNWMERNGAQVQIYVFEGGGIDGKGRMLRLDTTEGVTDTTWIAKQWSFATEPATWVWEKVADYESDARFRMGAQIDPLGKSTAYQRDAASGAITGREHRSASGTVVSRESTEYNGMRLPTRHQDANGLITRSAYDDQGNLRFRTEGIVLMPDGETEDAGKAVTWEWRYRSDGQVSQEIDPLGRVTDYEYDSRGFRTAEISPPDDPLLPDIRARKQWHYDVAGRLEWSKDAANHTTQYVYDERNRVREVRYGNDSMERYDYGIGVDANLLLSKTDRDGMVTSYAYDVAGREISRTEGAQDPAAAITTTTSYLQGTDLPQTVTRAGQKTEYVYDTRKRVIETRRWVDGTRYLADRTVFDAADRVAYTEDAFGRRTYSVYDDLDRVTRSIREAVPGSIPAEADLAVLPRVLTENPPYVIEDTVYDAGGRVLTTTDARGVVTKLDYDQMGRMTDRWEALGTPVEAHWQWTYDAVGNRETEIDPLLHVTRFTYTGRNLLAAQTVAFGTDDAATMRFSYTLTGQRAAQTDANNHTTHWIYGNCCDWLEDVIDAAGYYTHYTYTPGGLTETVRDANLHVTRIGYDGLKRPSVFMNGDMETTNTIYDEDLCDAAGLSGTYAAELSRIADRTGHHAVAVRNHMQDTTVRVSDGLGRIVLSIDAERHVTQTVYDLVVIASDGATLVETVTTDPMNNTIRQRTDGLGRVREVIDAQQHVTIMRYDANGNRSLVTDPLGHTQSSDFDARNRRVSTTDATGHTTSTDYDLLGNVLRQSDGFGHATEFTYTARNQKKTEKDRLGNITAFSYDPAGNLLAISDADNEVRKATVTPEVYEAGKTHYTYTERNQLWTETFPGPTGGTRTYTYKPNSLLWTRTDQRGIVTTYTYDGANRLTDRAYSDGTADHFALDDAGRITTATSGRYGTVVERTWKPTGLIETETTIWPADISGVTSSTLVQYDYDAANRATTVTYPGGATLVREFTSRNQLDRLTLDGTQLAQAGYDDAGRRTSLLYGNGLTDTRTYTDDNRLESTVVGLAAPAQPVLSLGYVYDANRRKTDETDAITATRSQHFGYDDADRLKTWSAGTKSQSWDLSAVGDWKSTTVNGVVENREHTPVHEIAKVNNFLALHDAAGNLARTAQGQGFSWDAENRLLMADIAPNSEKTQGQAFYWYDALGRRVAKRVHDSVTRYVHDGWQVIQELDAPVVATPAEAASDGPLTNLATVPDGALLYPTFDADGTRHDPVRVNFQPETTAIPDGFIADKGRLYNVNVPRTNGLTYGWLDTTGRPLHTIRHFHPLPQYDTFGLVAQDSTTWTWQIALPNGTYPVAIVAGDATSLAHTNNLVVNGTPLPVDPDPGDDTTVPTYEQGDFDGWLVSVQVTDGVLTITAGAEAFNPSMTHVEIGQKDQVITPEDWAGMQTRLADQILAATQRTGGSPFWNGGRTETRSYVWDPAYIDHLVAYQRTNEAGTQTYYAHSGAQYSVQAVTSESGAVVERYSYDAYGTRTVEGGSNGGRSAIGLTTGFTGRALDEETGLYYFRNRMYSGKDGRFVSRDPMGYVDGMSLYCGYFVPGGTDPNGEMVVFESAGAGVSAEDVAIAKKAWEDLEKDVYKDDLYMPWAKILQGVSGNKQFTLTVKVNNKVGEDQWHVLGVKSDGSLRDAEKENIGAFLHGTSSRVEVNINACAEMNDVDKNGNRVKEDFKALMIHEATHAYQDMTAMFANLNGLFAEKARLAEARGDIFAQEARGWRGNWINKLGETHAVAIENQYRAYKGLPQRINYGNFVVPIFEYQENSSKFRTDFLGRQNQAAFSAFAGYEVDPNYVNWYNLFADWQAKDIIDFRNGRKP
jgi:RHS repeat-associated protein